MSGAASDYNVARLFVGTFLASLVCILSFFTLPSLRPISSSGIYATLTISLHIVLMFATSYVEEEHNFWYWATSGWFVILFINNMRKSWDGKSAAIMALAVHRVIRRWNQTGQKYAGADDIVNSGIFHGSNSFVLWALIGATYMDVANRLASHVARSMRAFDPNRKNRDITGEEMDQNRFIGTIAVLPLCGTAFVFKLAFTAKDAPELTSGLTSSLLEWVDKANLVGLAQMIFGGIALSGIWIGFAEWQRANERSQWQQSSKREKFQRSNTPAKTAVQGSGGKYILRS